MSDATGVDISREAVERMARTVGMRTAKEALMRDTLLALAARLEAVKAERDELRAAKWKQQHTDTMNDIVSMGMARDEANAKLAQALEALRFYAKGEWPGDYPGGVLYAAGDDTLGFKSHLDYGDKARATLTALDA